MILATSRCDASERMLLLYHRQGIMASGCWGSHVEYCGEGISRSNDNAAKRAVFTEDKMITDERGRHVRRTKKHYVRAECQDREQLLDEKE